jgi:Fic family protein
MMTLRQLAAKHETIPSIVSWYLADISEARGKQELFIRQSPQRLKVLREHALIESAVSSNRIEGVEVEKARVGTIMFGKPALRDRNEEELHGYREALKLIHERGAGLPISEETILLLHKLARGQSGDAGQYKVKNGEIIERYPDGTSRMRFKPLSALQTPGAIRELVSLWEAELLNHNVHPLILLAAFNLDFLCIHPFRDGNGRASRLLMLLQCYHLGFEVGRYISLERLIEQNKERYYETLQQSSQGWHEGNHNPWPYIGYLLFILNTACREFENRLGRIKSPRGEKTGLIVQAIDGTLAAFSVADIQKQCPGVSIDMIRRTLKNLRAKGQIECLGRGQNAQWRKTKK